MTGLVYVLSPPEAVEQFRQIVRTVLEQESQLTPELQRRLNERAEELDVHPVDRDRVLQEVMTLPEVRRAIDSHSQESSVEPERTVDAGKAVVPVHRVTAPSPAPKQCYPSLWNPLNQLRLLWWLLSEPRHPQERRRNWAPESEEVIRFRLAHNLSLIPLMIPLLGLGLGLLRTAENAWVPEQVYLYLLVGLLLSVGINTFIGRDASFDSKTSFGEFVLNLVPFILAAITAFAITSSVASIPLIGAICFVAFSVGIGFSLGLQGIGKPDDLVGESAVFYLALSISLGVGIFIVLVRPEFLCFTLPPVSMMVVITAVLGCIWFIASPVAFLTWENSQKSILWTWLLVVLTWLSEAVLCLGGYAWLQNGSWSLPHWLFGSGG